MTEFFAFDNSIPPDTDRHWNKDKETRSREQGDLFRDYFTSLARDNGLERQVMIGGSFIGFAPPRLQVITDEETAQKLEKVSKGRVFMSKPKLH